MEFRIKLSDEAEFDFHDIPNFIITFVKDWEKKHKMKCFFTYKI